MKLDADERELLESAEGDEWKSSGGGKRPNPLCSLRHGHVPQGSLAEHPAVDQGPVTSRRREP